MMFSLETVGVNKAARNHGVPPTTLKDRISNRVQHGITYQWP